MANNNKPRIVRNGYLPERKITTGIGLVDVKLPRVRDRNDSKDKINFTSNIGDHSKLGGQLLKNVV